MDLKEENALGDNVADHWYYRAKLRAVLRALDGASVNNILDVGAGSGFFSRALLSETSAQAATCVDPNYMEEREEKVREKALRFVRSVDSLSVDLVLMMDVIEHVADDHALVANYVAMVPSGTRFLVTVPAFMFLWSNHDIFLEHYRRYTLGSLEAVLKSAGLRIECGHYFFGAVLPAVAAVRGWKRLTSTFPTNRSDMKSQPKLVNALLYQICALEARLMKSNRLGGTSVFALAIKP
jgi:2-polyprenyl-3-methyl-5-hydroxy-6-metoxy-1,4-benzoquinol methylase